MAARRRLCAVALLAVGLCLAGTSAAADDGSRRNVRNTAVDVDVEPWAKVQTGQGVHVTAPYTNVDVAGRRRLSSRQLNTHTKSTGYDRPANVVVDVPPWAYVNVGNGRRLKTQLLPEEPAATAPRKLKQVLVDTPWAGVVVGPNGQPVAVAAPYTGVYVDQGRRRLQQPVAVTAPGATVGVGQGGTPVDVTYPGGVVHVAPDGSTYVEYPGGVTNVQVPPSSPQTGSG